MSTLRILDREGYDAVLFRVALGTARICKEFSLGRPHYTVTSADGRVIAVPPEEYHGFFETKLTAHGAGDGLFGCHQTTHLTRKAVVAEAVPLRLRSTHTQESLEHMLGIDATGGDSPALSARTSCVENSES